MKNRYTKEQLDQIMIIKKKFSSLDNEIGGNELELLESKDLHKRTKGKSKEKSLPNKHSTSR